MHKYKVGERVIFTTESNPHNWYDWVDYMDDMCGTPGIIQKAATDRDDRPTYYVRPERPDNPAPYCFWWLEDDLFPAEYDEDFSDDIDVEDLISLLE